MNESTKKGLLIGLVVLAVGAAAFSAYKFTSTDKVEVVRTGPKPPPGKLFGKAAMMNHENQQR